MDANWDAYLFRLGWRGQLQNDLIFTRKTIGALYFFPTKPSHSALKSLCLTDFNYHFSWLDPLYCWKNLDKLCQIIKFLGVFRSHFYHPTPTPKFPKRPRSDLALEPWCESLNARCESRLLALWSIDFDGNVGDFHLQKIISMQYHLTFGEFLSPFSRYNFTQIMQKILVGDMIWVNFITSSRRERTLEIIVRLREIIPIYGRTIQVSELL